MNEFKEFILKYLSLLRLEANKTKSKYKRDLMKAQIIEYYYGLNGKKYNREEISILIDKVTIERIRQITKESLSDLLKNLIEKNSIISDESIDSIIALVNKYKAEKVLSQNQFYALNNISFDSPEIPFLDLLFDVFNFKKIKNQLHLIKDNDIYFFDENINQKDFIKICYATYIGVEQNTIPIDLTDLIIFVKRKLKTINVNKDNILLACKVIDSINILENNQFEIRFERISSSSDMAFRVLFENGSEMKFAEIQKEINYRIRNTVRKKIEKTSLNSQMNSDSRLIPIAKSGFWGLKEWNLENDSLYDLITNALISKNIPLTKKEIFAIILNKRPKIPTKSLDAIIYNNRYIQLKSKKFILGEWKDLYKDQIIKRVPRNIVSKENSVKEQIKDQIINLFSSNNSNEILLSVIVKTLHKNFNFPKASIYTIISEDKSFSTKFISTIKKTVTYKAEKKLNKNLQKSTSVFISYSWENQEFQEKIISFVDFLRLKGFEADMDIKIMQEETTVDFNRLMHQAILKYQKVIVILSPSYKDKAESFQGGVGKEYRYISSDIQKNSNKYILASFKEISTDLLDEIVPLDFANREVVDLVQDESNNFEKLFSKLTGFKKYVFSDVASNTPLIEKKEIKKFTLK